jgi:hypothetical protein
LGIIEISKILFSKVNEIGKEGVDQSGGELKELIDKFANPMS